MSLLPPTISQIYAKAMFDPRPTKTIISQKQLAYALGYPMDWRVERTVMIEDGKKIIQDRIHALGGKKNQTKYMWLHHEAAQKAALLFEKEGTLDPTAIEDGNTNGNNKEKETGSHLLPPIARFRKGEVVQVKYEDKWWAATITKRPKKKNDDEFYYSVVYHGDSATQDDIAEEDLRTGEDPSELAVALGFDATWSASRRGTRFVIQAPCGKTFPSKKAALKHFRDLTAGDSAKGKKRKASEKEKEDAGDPPWRRDGHDFIGRKMVWTFQHKASARRQITIEQVGFIEGYIDKADTDKEGNPGYVSEKTGKPASLFHVVFEDNPGHPYAQYLLDHTDVEEFEILENLLPPEEPKAKTPTSSKKRRR
uniref:Uncharacterized protein n=2 Tax=Pseudo-nitzschia delicatissima TaxID=44447 RepID=A0A7S0Y6B8_9STRA|mmetsp:Transcript_4230/g.8787  ORF Transcript_4230/g.8787 Transcript_4230/m.8787 type:complete len:366 (+) Transcript_4230:273-1370(+)